MTPTARRARRRAALLALVSLVAVASGADACGPAAAPPAGSPAASATTAVRTGGPAPGATGMAPGIGAIERTTTTEVPWAPTTTALAPPAPQLAAASCPAAAGGPAAAGSVAGAVGASRAGTGAPDAVVRALADLDDAAERLSVSVWVPGAGEIVAVQPDLALAPASNQKLLVAVAWYATGDTAATLPTTVVATGPTVGGVVRGDLVLVGGGDPTLLRLGPHSLASLAGAVRAAGVTGLTGAVRIDESRYDGARTAPGWPPNVWASNIGPLGAVVVDRNRGPGDPSFLLDPSPTLTDWFAAALRDAGIDAPRTGPAGPAGPGVVLAAESSPPVSELLATMLGRSDNLVAELLVKELDHRGGGPGSTAGGLARARDAAGRLCGPLGGTDGDGSGLSTRNARSAGDWRRLLTAARAQPWWPTMEAALPTSGLSGTLVGRLADPGVAGRVHAKTGSVYRARAMSGEVLLPDGRTAVFSVVADGGRADLEKLVDAFVASLATSG